MPRFRTRPALVLLCALLYLTACGPTAIGSVSPTATATVPPAPTATPTLAPAPTPTNVPAGWVVLTPPHFSLAYPPDWTPQTYPQQDGSVLYNIAPPNTQAPSVRVSVSAHVQDPNIKSPYCLPVSSDIQHTTLASLPMMYMISGEGMNQRTWIFANAQRTVYTLDAGDANADAVTQAQDAAILATFRPDNADPWSC